MDNSKENKGLFGYIKNAKIKDLCVGGKISIAGKVAGGIIGYLDSNSEINKCTNEVEFNQFTNTLK